jgi:hypothetical protein
MKKLASRCVAACLLFCSLASVPADACSRSLSTVYVPPDFRIRVAHDGNTVPGITIEIYDNADLDRKKDGEEWKPILTSQTDPQGRVKVKNLAPGSYLVQTKGPAAGSAVYATVSTKYRREDAGISLEWPFSWLRTLKTRALAGEFASNNPWKPFEKIHVELWTAGAALPLAAVDTDREGGFHFSETNPGIYVLRIRGDQKRVTPDWQVEGDIPIELLPDDKNAPPSLTLYLSESSCGIQYNSCPIPAAEQLPSRRFQVNDPLGAVIAHANYRVLDPTGAELATGTTDSNGIIELPSDLKGKVTLVVASPGFALFSLPLDLITPDDPASYLAIVMGVQGYGGDQCSKAVLEKHATQK